MITKSLEMEELKLANEINRTPRMIFADRLSLSRKGAGMTQKDLADAIGVSKAAVEKWEYGEREIGLENLIKISGTLKVPTDYLLGLSDYGSTVNAATMNDRIKSILSKAKQKGEIHFFLFELTLRQYIEQCSLMAQLSESISKHGVVISKVNIKGDENLVANPAIMVYRSLAALSNDTEKLLISLCKNPLTNNHVPDEFELFY